MQFSFSASAKDKNCLDTKAGFFFLIPAYLRLLNK